MTDDDRSWDARLLSQLYQQPDDQLDGVRKRYIDRKSGLSPERMMLVRGMLEALISVLRQGNDEAWARVERAARVLAASEGDVGGEPSLATAQALPGTSGHSFSEQTASLSSGNLARHSSAPLPFDADGEGGLPVLTVQQYAQLCARLAAHPHTQASLYAAAGLADDDEKARLDASWRARLEADPTQRQLFELLYQRVLAQLQPT